jgi:cytochrome c-type biogenesis protein CcmH
MAMAPNLKLSAFSEVVITARISKSGNAKAQSGDLQGASQAVKPGTSGVVISIDQVVQ